MSLDKEIVTDVNMYYICDVCGKEFVGMNGVIAFQVKICNDCYDKIKKSINNKYI
jgi:ribosome-binding protein aMBF1 (putative translation factor)